MEIILKLTRDTHNISFFCSHHHNFSRGSIGVRQFVVIFSRFTCWV